MNELGWVFIGSWANLLACMLFVHVIWDFRVQGILADMKCKRWWREQALHPPVYYRTDVHYTPEMYSRDYIAGLLIHGFEWSAAVHLPILIFVSPDIVFSSLIFPVSIVINGAVHAFIDHLKCNRLSIDLNTDQFLHLVQLTVTSAVLAIALAIGAAQAAGI